jgi:HEAT repeat protein
MSPRRLAKLVSVTAFAAALFGLAFADGLEAAGKQEEAKKYHDQLKTTKDAKKKVEALEELGKLGQIMKSLAEPAIPDILKAAEDKSADVRKAAAEALGKCDPDPKDAVPALTKLLKEDKDDGVKIAAAHGLGYMGDTAQDATKDLREVAKANRGSDGKPNKLGRAAGEALRSINGKKK